MLMTKQDLHVRQIVLPPYLDDSECVIIRIEDGTTHVHVASLYSPPTSRLPIPLLQYLSTLSNIVITTDINAHHELLHDNRRNPKGTQLATLLPNLSYIQIPLPAPTRTPYLNQNFTTPDKIFTSHRLQHRITDIKVLAPLNTDHSPIIFKLASTTYRPTPDKETILTRDFRHADWTQFKTHITLTLPDIAISKPEDIDHADETFVQVLEAALDISIPTRKRTTDTRRRLPPDIIKLIKTKRAAHRLYTRTHADEDRRLYRSLQQDVRETIQRFEAHRWKKFIDRLDHNRTHNPKLFWDVIKRIRGKHANSNHPLRDGQQIVYDTPGKLDLLSRTLENIHTTPNHPSFDPQHLAYITHHITQNPDLYEPLPAPLPRSTDDPLIDNITPLDISLELRNIKNSAPGPDQITYNILRQLPPKALNYLGELYTGSLRLGHTPKRWKHSHILLFPKPGKDASDPQNYRPISLTTTLAKLMEKVLVSRLHVYMRNRNLIPTTQAGFRPGAQLHDQLIRVLTPIEEAYTHRHYSILIALDAKRAFDTVWIDALKYKLTSLNLPQEITRWLSSFISNRTGQVRLGRNELSRTFRIEAGVPQGSVISPTLYNIYVADIPLPNNPLVGLAQYADDVAYWATHPRLPSARKLLNATLRQYLNWTNTWRVTVNTDKTQICVFRPKLRTRVLQNNPITIANTQLPLQRNLTYLGIPLTSKLSWTEVAKETWRKYNGAIRAISYLSGINRPGCITETLLHLYKALVRSLCIHPSIFLTQAPPTTQSKFEARERRILRQIFHLHRRTRNNTVYTTTKTKPLFTHLNNINRKYTHSAVNRVYTQHIFANPPNTNNRTTLEKLLYNYHQPQPPN